MSETKHDEQRWSQCWAQGKPKSYFGVRSEWTQWKLIPPLLMTVMPWSWPLSGSALMASTAAAALGSIIPTAARCLVNKAASRYFARSTCFTGLLALLAAPVTEGAETCGQLAKYKGEVDTTKESSFTMVPMMTMMTLMMICIMIFFMAGVCLGWRMARPSKSMKEVGIQTEKLERMSVSVDELTIESIKIRLRSKDLRMSGLKNELADRLAANARW